MNAIHFPVNDIYDFLYGLYLDGFLEKSYENGLVIYKIHREYNKDYDAFYNIIQKRLPGNLVLSGKYNSYYPGVAVRVRSEDWQYYVDIMDNG